MGVAGLIFEAHPPNVLKFEQIDVQMIYLYWFQIFKDQCGSVSSIPVAVLE